MKLLTEREQIKNVAIAWAAQYRRALKNINPGESRRNDTLIQLEELDKDTATADDVAKIIGNNSWVAPVKCDECGKETWNAIQVGEEPDYQSRTATLCFDCIQKALVLMGSNDYR